MTDDPVTAEATGETVAEAKWQALRELELLAPGLDRAAVRFEVLDAGRRGLLGVGYAPARVLASAAAPAALPSELRRDGSVQAARLRELLEHVCAALGLRCAIEVEESEEALEARCSGGDVSRLIGHHGHTLDAVQTLASAIVGRAGDRKHVVVDAAGYRDRRLALLRSVALRGAEEALRTGAPVALEPMSAAERRVVHEQLAERAEVETSSEGDEPYRRVVVAPARPA